MPFCPECKFEYRKTVVRCPDCGSQLVAALPSKPSPPPRPLREALLCTIQGELHAKLLQNRLQLAGIPSRAQLAGILETPYYLAAMPPPVSAPTDVVIRIYVREEELHRARRAYDDFETAGHDPPSGSARGDS